MTARAVGCDGRGMNPGCHMGCVCVWYKAVAYREQVHFVEIKEISMGVRGMSVGMAMDTPLVVVVGLQLQWWGSGRDSPTGGYIKEK